MKIADVTATLLSRRYATPIHFAHMELTERFIVLLRVYTDQGIVGLGDIDGAPAGDTFRPLLLGQDPLDIGARNQDMFGMLNTLGRYPSQHRGLAAVLHATTQFFTGGAARPSPLAHAA